ncbi:subclass B1 metallo-beta-lactamase [Mucilaginibacter sp.]|jgi:metallo-beta-lactamase class B|uniref:subclass B1 metallo-beta-lactamase n=1 Tax=Mucilaginibacter sp. TaxID=1882438 RepID=UPI0035614F44
MKIKISILFLLVSVIAKAQTPAFKISIKHLTQNFYVCTSYGLPDGPTPFPANSLFAVTDAGIVLVDTPWDENQTQQLIDSVKQRFNKNIVLCISTHFHDDRTGGVAVLKKHGTKTYSTKLTQTLAKTKGLKVPEFTFKNDTTFTVGGIKLQTYFPGPGHTADNIVVWFPQDKILVGGCLVKSMDTESKGYLADANVTEWPKSIRKVYAKFKQVNYLIPGHQGWQGGREQLTHTIKVVSSTQ